ncbi:MAG: class I SAM-dependent methyltransferase [Flavobacteriales bacterium]|nr:class I SAM-dependent methyltransferase [Flavobacteriales bacterium]
MASDSKVRGMVQDAPKRVGDFYDRTTPQFLEVYGEIIQAFRTTDVADYLDYTIASAQLADGQHIIDAGCGICGPAAYFAGSLARLKVESCTVSSVQSELAREHIRQKGVEDRVNVTLGDYHRLPSLFPPLSFDRVIFLESFGHSKDKAGAVRSAWEVLRPGGKLYIKDLFRRESKDEWEQLHIDHICGQIDRAYEYEVGDLHQVLSAIRKQGFILEFLRPPQVPMEKFEHLSISNDFQNLFGIGKIDSWDSYVFPIDFYEILAVKPAYSAEKEQHLYHLNRKD